MAPYALAGQGAAQVVVSRYGDSSDPVSVPVADVSPKVFPDSLMTCPGSSSGNEFIPGCVSNSPDNPAVPGRLLDFLITGAGVWDVPVQEGAIGLWDQPFKTLPVGVTVGGVPALIRYVGAVPYQPMGVLMVIAVVPRGVSGLQPLVVTVGDVSNVDQGVNVSVQ